MDRAKLRKEVHGAYGDKCQCCGEQNTKFLTLDHINNDGASHRKTLTSNGGAALLRWAIKNNYPHSLQLLCYNCNCGRFRNDGVCPHEVRNVRD